MPTLVSFREDVLDKPTPKPTPKTKPSTRRRRKPYHHQDHYLCDFYENIWTARPARPEREIPNSLPPPRMPSIHKPKPKPKAENRQFVDIAQVAYALATSEHARDGCEPTSASPLNLWAMALPRDGFEAPEDDVKALRLKPSTKPRPSTITEDSRDSLAPTHDNDNDVEEGEGEGEDGYRLRKVELELAALRARSAATTTKRTMPPLSVDTAIPPPSKMNGSIVFSTVFMEEGEWGWSIRFLLGLHEPVRHALFVMDRFLAQSQQEQELAVLEHHTREFFVWFNAFFVEYLTTQREVKVQVLLPLIKVPYAVKREIAGTCDDIGHDLAEIQAQEQTLLAGPGLDHGAWLRQLGQLQRAIRSLNMTVYAVLNLEEKTLHPALAEAFTEKTFRTYVLPRVFRIIKAKKVVVPWMIERSKVWGGEAEQQSFQGMLPFSARFLYKKVWRPYFVSNVAVAMTHLDEWDADASDRRQERCLLQ